VIFGGGVPLRNKDGEIIGGLGVSGGTGEQDTALAEYGEAVFHNCI
jgi:cob(I)alamin adenosyltransferase